MNKRNISQEEFNKLVAQVCRDIAMSGWRPDYVVGLVSTGLVAATMISRYFDVPLCTLNANTDEPRFNESNCWMAEDAFGYSDTPMNILIVDAVNSDGAKFNWIKEDWQSGCFPKGERWKEVWNGSTRFAVLLDYCPGTGVDVDYSAEELNKLDGPSYIEFPYDNWWS
jgi:hypothetical protein